MLRQKIQADQIQALKNHDAKTLETLRYILSQIQNKEIDKRAELDDKETLDVLKKIIKELKESIEGSEKAGRQNLVDENKKQLELVVAYLPEELSDEEIKKEIERLINDNKELYGNNPKAIIGICMKELKDKADSSRIMKILREVQGS